MYCNLLDVALSRNIWSLFFKNFGNDWSGLVSEAGGFKMLIVCKSTSPLQCGRRRGLLFQRDPESSGHGTVFCLLTSLYLRLIYGMGGLSSQPRNFTNQIKPKTNISMNNK